MNLSWKTLIFSLFLFLLIPASGCRSTKSKPAAKTPVSKETEKPSNASKSKLEQKVGFKMEGTYNSKLYEEIVVWLGTPYKYGGCTKAGTDCSCFVFNIYKEVFNKTLPRSTIEIAKEARKISANELKQGDLIFFNTNGSKISHIGMHLQGDKFVHASTKKGVMISSMNEEYFINTFKNYGSYF